MPRKRVTIFMAALAVAVVLPAAADRTEEEAMSIEVTSSAFVHEGLIPRRYTCDGEDISPPLVWRGLPEGTMSLALIVDDPDAPRRTWVHWVIFNLPPGSGNLPENVPPQLSLPGDSRQGMNDFGRVGYGGPCPPAGMHRYYFRIYALDSLLDLAPGSTKEALLKAMAGHILGEGELMGKYRR